jgi:hypothetical protein
MLTAGDPEDAFDRWPSANIPQTTGTSCTCPPGELSSKVFHTQTGTHSPLKTLKMRLKGEPSGGTLTYRLATAPAMNRLIAAMKAAVGMPKPTPAGSTQWVGNGASHNLVSRGMRLGLMKACVLGVQRHEA